MVASFVGTALTTASAKSLKKLANKIVVGILKEEIYNDKRAETEEGELKENLVLKLLLFLEGNKENFLALPGSSLDCDTKVDVVAVFTDITFAFQVKSSQQAAETHIRKSCFLNGNKIATPGVIWIDRGTHPLLVARELSRFLNQPIKEEVLACLTIAKQFKGKTLPVKTFKLSPLQLHALAIFNVAKVEGNNIRF